MQLPGDSTFPPADRRRGFDSGLGFRNARRDDFAQSGGRIGLAGFLR